MAYRAEAMSQFKVGLSSPHRLQSNKISNDELRRCELDFLDEMRNESQVEWVI